MLVPARKHATAMQMDQPLVKHLLHHAILDGEWSDSGGGEGTVLEFHEEAIANNC